MNRRFLYFIAETGTIKPTNKKVNGWSVKYKIYLNVDNENNYKEKSSPHKNLITNVLNADATADMKKIFKSKVFEYAKPSSLIEQFLRYLKCKNCIVLDSFAGSGTTAHAVIKRNKEDNGNRKFILIEMMDYAETITAERIRRVANGYGEGKTIVDGLGGEFDYYELGEPLFDKEKNLNETVGEQKIREYIYYTETKQHLKRERKQESQYLLDTHNDTGYYFYYDRNNITTLSIDTLNIVTERAEQYVIYADICVIDKEDLTSKNIIFKKIPRDIKRF